MKVAIYARVSLDENDESKGQFQNPENQIQPLLEYCASIGWEVRQEHIYIDIICCANPARPRFNEMIADALQRRFSGIVVWKLDRFSREGITPTLAYIQQLSKQGVWLRSMTESWLDTSQEGTLALLSWAAATEHDKISERTKAGIARLKALGKWRGGRPKKGGTKSP